jgi:AraC-like DNA-binding protein
MARFVDLPSSELRDGWLPVDDVWSRTLDRLRDRMASAGSTGEVLRVLEDELRSRLGSPPPRGLQLVQHTAGRLEASWGDVPVAALTDDAGVSSNHLATRFKSHVGVTPKRVARIYRFARLILSVDAARPVDWAQLAHAAGYFDQAHMSKEFKDFTGHSPTGYWSCGDGSPPRRTSRPTAGRRRLCDFVQACGSVGTRGWRLSRSDLRRMPWAR